MEDKSVILELEAIALRTLREGHSLDAIPEEFMTMTVVLEAIKINLENLKFVPDKFQTEDFFKQALKLNYKIFKDIPQNLRTEDLLLEALLFYGPLFLQFIPEQMKKDFIDKITVQKMLADNYSAHHYFPKGAYQHEIVQFLSKIKYVVVIEEENTLADKEIRDSYEVYANETSPKPGKTHQGRTLLVYHKDLADLLCKLQQNPRLHLTLLDHVLGLAFTSGMDIPEICNTLKEHSNIRKVTFLSCESVKASAFHEEEKAIIGFKKEHGDFFSNNYGLAYMTHFPEKEEQVKLLKNQKGCYVLIEEPKSCILLQKNKDRLLFPLNEQRFEACQKRFMRNKYFKIPKDSKYQLIRGGKEHYLNNKDKLFFLELFQMISFNKMEPSYQALKNKFPFFQKVIIKSTDEEELKKLNPSLVTSLVEALKASQEVKQEVMVEGFRWLVHVDLVTRNFSIVSEPIYKEAYPTTPENTEDNIKRGSLENLRDEAIKSAQKEQSVEIAETVKVHYKP